MRWFEGSGTCKCLRFSKYSRESQPSMMSFRQYLSVLIVFRCHFVLMFPSKNMLFWVLGMQCLQITSIHLHLEFEVVKMRHNLALFVHLLYNNLKMIFYLSNMMFAIKKALKNGSKQCLITSGILVIHFFFSLPSHI